MPIEVRTATEQDRQLAAKWPLWQKEPTEFRWNYMVPEACLLVEGSAEIETNAGNVTLKAGDFAVFPQGLKCRWKILKPLSKRYHFG